MAGRQTFFSFHYQQDIWRVNVVRNSNLVDARAAAGWKDASLWEEARKKGDADIKRMIDRGLDGTSVTVVLIGSDTANRKYVNYEIDQSLARGNGLLGIHINSIGNVEGQTPRSGPVPQRLIDAKAPVYAWDREKFGRWVEQAAIAVGKACLPHETRDCFRCR